jgi:SAM-dependent methyltransferase
MAAPYHMAAAVTQIGSSDYDPFTTGQRMTLARLWRRIAFVPARRYRDLDRRFTKAMHEIEALRAQDGARSAMCAPIPGPAGADVPLPPADLRFRVAGTDSPKWFLDVGRTTILDFEAALALLGRRLQDFQDIYDFGCGCGRVTRWLPDRAPEARLHASDIDTAAIAWLRQHMPNVNSQVNGGRPPLPFDDGAFDLVLGYSVFTHFDEDYQDAWLAELRRVTRPGAVLLLTVHGLFNWGYTLADHPELSAARDELRRRGTYLWRTEYWSQSFPDYYQTSWHLPWYIRRHWCRWFAVLDVLETHARPTQDMVVLCRMDDAQAAMLHIMGGSASGHRVAGFPLPPSIVPGGAEQDALPVTLKSDYRVEWIDHQATPEMRAGGEYAVPVRLRNAGMETWPRVNPSVQLSYDWLPADGGEPLTRDDVMTDLPHDVSPGEDFAADVRVLAPAVPGSYQLQLTLVSDSTIRFQDRGAATLTVPVTVSDLAK